MSSAEHDNAAFVTRPDDDTVAQLARRVDADVTRRTDIRVWEQSGVERLYLDDARTVILKYCIGEFAEADVLVHAAAHDVPVPELLGHMPQDDGSVVMLIEDLGDEAREATLADAAQAAVLIHACPPVPGRPVLDATALAELPERALGWLAQLREVRRWGTAEADQVKRDLEWVAKVAERRSQGAERPPFGLAHSELHPTSIHIGAGGMRILDWARAYTGNGLLDLVSWQGTRDPLDLDKVSTLIEAYVAAGGPTEAKSARGGLPAHVWASGWDKMWVCEWLMEGTTRWADASMDASLQETIGRHLREVVTCLTD